MLKQIYRESIARKLATEIPTAWPQYAQLGYSELTEDNINVYSDLVTPIGPVIPLPDPTTNHAEGGPTVLTYEIVPTTFTTAKT